MPGDFDPTDFFSTDFKTEGLDVPSLLFAPASLNFGTITAGSSCAMISYDVKQGAGKETAQNLSISVSPSLNSADLIQESWCYTSTADEGSYIGSYPGAPECAAPNVAASSSIQVRTKLRVPSDAPHGQMLFGLHHRYQYTG